MYLQHQPDLNFYPFFWAKLSINSFKRKKDKIWLKKCEQMLKKVSRMCFYEESNFARNYLGDKNGNLSFQLMIFMESVVIKLRLKKISQKIDF